MATKREEITYGDLKAGDVFVTPRSGPFTVLEDPTVKCDDKGEEQRTKDGVPKLCIVISPPDHGQTVHAMGSDKCTRLVEADGDED